MRDTCQKCEEVWFFFMNFYVDFILLWLCTRVLVKALKVTFGKRKDIKTILPESICHLSKLQRLNVKVVF